MRDTVGAVKTASRDRARAKVERIAGSAPDVTSLLWGAAAAARQVVPMEGWCGFTLDPVAMVKTAGVHEAGLSPDLLGHIADLEYRQVDANRFAAAGMGWDRPADPNDPQNHAKNRRVEIKVYSAEKE